METQDETNPLQEDTKEVKFEFDIEKLESLLLNYFKGLDALFSSYKQKDINLLCLSKELADYRNGLTKTLFKSLATHFISYRESILKQREDLDSFEYDIDILKEYFSLFEDNLSGLFMDIDLVKREDGSLIYNGKDIQLNKEPFKELEITLPVEENEEIEKPQFHSMEDVENYLSKMNQKMIAILKNKEVIDLLLSKAIALNRQVKMQETQVLLYPVLRKAAKLDQKLKDRIQDSLKIEEKEEYLKVFKENLQKMASEIDDILFSCGITIDSLPLIQGEYDPKTMQSLGFVNTSEESLHGKVALSFSPCYFFEDSVFKKAKIKLYRFVK